MRNVNKCFFYIFFKSVILVRIKLSLKVAEFVFCTEDVLKKGKKFVGSVTTLQSFYNSNFPVVSYHSFQKCSFRYWTWISVEYLTSDDIINKIKLIKVNSGCPFLLGLKVSAQFELLLLEIFEITADRVFMFLYLFLHLGVPADCIPYIFWNAVAQFWSLRSVIYIFVSVF